jgi:hypothetical protein
VRQRIADWLDERGARKLSPKGGKYEIRVDWYMAAIAIAPS